MMLVFLKVFSDFSSAESLGLVAASDVGQVLPSPALGQKQLKPQAKGVVGYREEESVLVR